MPPQFLYNRPEFKKLRQSLRNAHTPAEYELWKYLRQRRMLGYKFRRQYGIGSYVLDFFCPELRLCIEVDGETHALPHEINRDQQRQTFIEQYGIHIIRVLNSDIYENIDGVIEILSQKVEARAKERSSTTTS